MYMETTVIRPWRPEDAPALAEALDHLDPRNPRWKELCQMVEAFRAFPTVDPALVPASSLLREFIGGGSYHYS